MDKKIITIDFKEEDDCSDFIKILMKSENGKDCFVKMGHDGNNFYIELKPQWESK